VKNVTKLRELLLSEPTADDHKYSRGVVGFITGSTRFPGAALLGVTAAIQSGCGYVRFVGNDRLSNFVLSQRPEVVCEDGYADAWVLGSGVPEDDLNRIYDLATKFRDSRPMVIDAGALSHLHKQRPLSDFIITPHHKEAQGILEKLGVVLTLDEIAADPESAAMKLAELTGGVVNLKANVSVIAAAGEKPIITDPLNTYLSTAGTGDLLAGVTGALLARHVKQIGVPDRKRMMRIAALGLRVMSAAAEISSKRTGVGASDIASNIHLAAQDLAE
jgi:hydroxyethylthiazole kinase-like uncharacterized protein yjeF